MNNATAARIRASLQAAFEHKLEAHFIASDKVHAVSAAVPVVLTERKTSNSSGANTQLDSR